MLRLGSLYVIFLFVIVLSSFYRSRCRSRPYQPGSFVFCSVLSLFCRFIFIFIDRASFSSFWVVFHFFLFWYFCAEVDVSFFYNVTYFLLYSTLFVLFLPLLPLRHSSNSSSNSSSSSSSSSPSSSSASSPHRSSFHKKKAKKRPFYANLRPPARPSALKNFGQSQILLENLA